MKSARTIGCVLEPIRGKIMAGYIAAPRNSLPRQKQLRADLRGHDATTQAQRIGRMVLETLPRIKPGTSIKRAVKSALRAAGYFNCKVVAYNGEVHVYIGKVNDKRLPKKHGHIIVVIAERLMRYCRGYGMPHGPWNCCVVKLP